MPETLVCPDSLGDTLDAIQAALFERVPLSAVTWAEAAAWLAERQGLPGAYAGMFAPTQLDYSFGALTFTGDALTSRAAIGHTLGEEAATALARLSTSSGDMRRALDGLGVAPAEVQTALLRANQNMDARIRASQAAPAWLGIYCCGTCSAAIWRRINAQDAGDDTGVLAQGLDALNHQRDGMGRWRRFPWYYTVLVLSEIPLPQAREELRYAATLIERTLNRLTRASAKADSPQKKYDRRRRILLQRALEMLP